MPQFQQRRKSKRPRWRILVARKFCSAFSHAFAPKPSRRQHGFSSEMRMMKPPDHGGGRRRAFKIARIRCKWNNSKKKSDENGERSNNNNKQLGSRFSALLGGLGKKAGGGFGVSKWKISPVNKVGSNEDSFSGERDEEEEELELCKKRILMGERCRPLNSSGSLRYDRNGVLLPEEFLPNES